MTGKTNRKEILLLIILSPILLVILIVVLIAFAVAYPFVKLYEQWLKYRFWQLHGKFGRFILLVYSDSPNWKGYIDENILPRIEPHAVVLNWSQRREWSKSNPFESRVFRRWAGEREFNPMAIVIRPKGKIKKVRFWQAFRDLKHGNEKLLKECETTLFNELEKCPAKGY
jgi:hypothetical protein